MKTLTISLSVILYFFCLNFQTQAQKQTQNIKGRVTDKATENPLPGVLIIIEDTDMAGITDSEGYFIIEHVSLGRYNITANLIGYLSKSYNEILISSGKESVLNFEMDEFVDEIDEVVINSFNQKDQPINTMATVSARSFSVEETRRYAGGLDDPARMVSAFAGVVTTTGSQNNAIIIRGNAPKGVLWRLEGVEIPNPNHFAGGNVEGGGFVTIFSSQMLTNSDFYTSAFPAEFGNAMAGVFDMKMRTGNRDKREHTFQIGVLGIDLSSEGPFKKGKNATYLFNYRYSTMALLMNIIPTEQVPEYQDLSFKLNFPTKKSGTFSLWGSGGDDYNKEPVTDDSTFWETDWDRVYYDMYIRIGAAGLNHKYILGKKSFISTTAAISGNFAKLDMQRYDDDMVLKPYDYLSDLKYKYTLTSYINTKFSAKHVNRTGLILNDLRYKIDYKYYNFDLGKRVQNVNANDHSYLLQAYSQSKYNFSENLYFTGGIHFQYFNLNGNYSIEPRVSLKWKLNNRQALSFGYGNHGQLEKLSVYLSEFIKPETNEIIYPNKQLEFSKAHHFVLAYDHLFTKNLRIKIEPYYQYLYNVPVKENNSYSMINYVQEFFVFDTLINDGTGKNYGLDITLERFLADNYYYMINGSLFESKYTGGDEIERYSRYNSNFVLNLLGGKEFIIKTKKGKENYLGINARLTLFGGERDYPIDHTASNIAQDVIFETDRPFESQNPNYANVDLTITYKVNHKKANSVWALQIKNALASDHFFGYDYNYKNKEVEAYNLKVVVPVISYKIDF